MLTQDFPGNNMNGENLLIEACRGLIDNRIKLEDFNRIYDRAKTDLKDLRKDFDGTLSPQPDNVKRTCQVIIRDINRAFDEYERELNEIKSYFHTFDKNILENAISRIGELSNMLDQYLFEFRENALIALGPSRIPNLNLFFHTVYNIQQGMESTDKLAYYVEREGPIVEQLLDELDSREQTQEIVAQKTAYIHFLETIDILAEYLESEDAELLESAGKLLNQTVEMFKSAGDSFDLDKLSKYPTQSPSANIIINLSSGLLDGRTPPELFAENLDRLWEELELTRYRFDTIRRNPGDSRLVEEEAEIVGETLVAFEEVLTEYFEALENWNLQYIEETNEKLKSVIMQIHQSMEIFDGISKKEGKVICVKCGYFNPPGLRYCEKCNFKLPKIVSAESDFLNMKEGADVSSGGKTMPMMTENINRLFEAGTKVAGGEISIEEFEDVVIWMESKLEQAFQKAGPLPYTNPANLSPGEREKVKKMDEALKEAAEVYIQGLEDFEVGISFFRQYINTGNRQSIETGKQMIWQSAVKLQEVQKATEPLKGK